MIVGDSNLGHLYALPLDATRSTFAIGGFAGVADLVADSVAERDQFRIGSGFGSITDLTLGPDGHLYVVSLGNGTVYRIAGPAVPIPVPGLPVPGLVVLALMLWGLAAFLLRFGSRRVVPGEAKLES